MLDRDKLQQHINKLTDDKKELATITLNELEEIDKRLDELRKQPFIATNPDPDFSYMKKKTIEYEVYKDLLAQKNLYVKTLFTLINRYETEDDDNPFKDFDKKFEEYNK